MEKAISIPADDFLYAQVAGRIEKRIRQNLLNAGDKLLSVRALSNEQGISISTAYKAYVELENMGMIEARPKSGYYVKFSPARFTKAPEIKPPSKKIEQVSVVEMIAMIYQNMSEDSVLRLCRAAPPLDLIPLAKLNRSMMEAMRKSPSGNSNYENLQGNISLRKQVAKNAFNWGGNITKMMW